MALLFEIALSVLLEEWGLPTEHNSPLTTLNKQLAVGLAGLGEVFCLQRLVYPSGSHRLGEACFEYNICYLVYTAHG